LEALRLADLLGLHQEEAAAEMKISRPTFGRILEQAHRKVAEALIFGKSLQINTKGGNMMVIPKRTFVCYDCGKTWQVPCGTNRPQTCPACSSRNIHRSPEERGPRWGCRRGRWQMPVPQVEKKEEEK
jgi:predicted Zn-ribbon and HTH transcriptional regulator